MAIAEVNIIPLGTKTPSVSKHLVHALRVLREEKNIKYELFIAGDGELRNLVENFAKKNPNIFYLGFLDQKGINELVSRMNFVVVPSVWLEPFGLVIIESLSKTAREALACNLRVLSFDLRYLNEFPSKHSAANVVAKIMDKIESL